MTAEPLRIAVIANKAWECEPLVAALTSKDGGITPFFGRRRGYDPAEEPPNIDPATNRPPRPASRGRGPLDER